MRILHPSAFRFFDFNLNCYDKRINGLFSEKSFHCPKKFENYREIVLTPLSITQCPPVSLVDGEYGEDGGDDLDAVGEDCHRPVDVPHRVPGVMSPSRL